MARLADSEKTIWVLRARVTELEEQLEAALDSTMCQENYDAACLRADEAERLVERAAVLLHNSTPPRHERWHDDFEQWLQDARAVAYPASEPSA